LSRHASVIWYGAATAIRRSLGAAGSGSSVVPLTSGVHVEARSSMIARMR
jgi:hypothetical protein